MKIHEYQGKEVLAQHGVPVPRGIVITEAEAARAAAEELGGRVVVKAQIHSGARGKAGALAENYAAAAAGLAAGTLATIPAAIDDLGRRNSATIPAGPMRDAWAAWAGRIDEQFRANWPLDRDGVVVTPLDLHEVRHTASELVSAGVEAIAVCFLHAYANPAHERRAVAAQEEPLARRLQVAGQEHPGRIKDKRLRR